MKRLTTLICAIALTVTLLCHAQDAAAGPETPAPFPATGHVYEVNFGGDNLFQLNFKSDTEMTFTALVGDGKGVAETVRITPTQIRPGVFMVSWTEASKTEVVHIEDFGNGVAYTNITPPNEKTIHLKGTMKQIDSQVEANKSAVVDFYELAFNQHKPTEAAKKYIGDQYIQHNPDVPNGAAAFYTYFEQYFKEHPQSHVVFSHVVAEGNLVILHLNSKADDKDRGTAIVDIFRLENGKIVEHWDVTQDVPEKTVSGNSMF